MTEDRVTPILRRLTVNGALNLRGTIEDPDPKVPDWLNGARRLSTGLGKWTTISAMGVENHLRSLGLIEERDVQPVLRPGPFEKPVLAYCLTPLGMEVARHLHDHWDEVDCLRDTDQERRDRERRRAERVRVAINDTMGERQSGSEGERPKR